MGSTAADIRLTGALPTPGIRGASLSAGRISAAGRHAQIFSSWNAHEQLSCSRRNQVQQAHSPVTMFSSKTSQHHHPSSAGKSTLAETWIAHAGELPSAYEGIPRDVCLAPRKNDFGAIKAKTVMAERHIRNPRYHQDAGQQWLRHARLPTVAEQGRKPAPRYPFAMPYPFTGLQPADQDDNWNRSQPIRHAPEH